MTDHSTSTRADRRDAAAALSRGRRSFPARLLALALAALAPACAAGERLEVPTTDPYDFAQMAPGAPATTRVHARLILPPGDTVPRGAAILSHGAAGPGSRQTRMAERLAADGIAALVMDHFGPRGVGSTTRDQLRVTEQTMIADLHAARAVLAERLAIDPGRIGLIGWSKGATAVTLASVARLSAYAAPGAAPLPFAIAFYPFCGFDLSGEALGAPLLLLLAGQDDWTPAAPCRAQAEAWQAAGQPVDWRLYEDALHGFDSTAAPRRIDSPVTVRDTSPACTLTVDARGRTVTLDDAHALGSPEGRRRFLAACGVRGVSFGGDAAARADADRAVRAFIDTRLAN